MEIPEKMIDTQVDNMLGKLHSVCRARSVHRYVVKYTGMTADQMKDQIRPEAVKRIQTRLVLEAVVEAKTSRLLRRS